MAAPVQNNITTGRIRPATPAPIPSSQPQLFVDLGHNIYIKNRAEHDLYVKWLALPHRGLNADSYIKLAKPPQLTPMMAGIVAASVTEEQEKRFSLCAQHNDIHLAMSPLRRLSNALDLLFEVLTTEQADAMADFDSEFFKKVELEDMKDAQRSALIEVMPAPEV